MPRRHLILLLGSLLAATPLLGQLQAKLVSFDYQQAPLSEVLDELSDSYALHFSYSPDRLPLDFPLTGAVRREPVGDALTVLFTDTPIRFAIIGEQIALRADAQMLSRLEARPVRIRQESPIYPAEPRPYTPPAERIARRDLPPIGGGDTSWNEGLDAESLELISEAIDEHERRLAADDWNDRNRLAQISLLPYLGTNSYRSAEITNQVSLNVLWGTSAGVNGFELGGVANSVTNDMQGVQIAGGANWIGGQVVGTQFAGGFNYVKGPVAGLQMAIGGNITQDSMVGTQVGGLFNMGRHHVAGTQVAVLFNAARGNVGTQVSLLYNEAEDVERRQIGLINVSDTTRKAPIGLLNIVRYGYNRVELGTSEVLFANLSGKFGAYRLYNIFHLGVRWDASTSNDLSGNFTSWALGYGLGRADRLGREWLLNTELIGMQVNEQQAWTRQLNLLVQLRLTVDWQPGRRLSFYAGPVLNTMWSERINPITGELGTNVAPYTWWNEQRGGTQFLGWLGFTAGIRI